MQRIKIKVEPPGQKAKKIVEDTQRYLSPSIQRFYPFVIKKGKGAIIEDVDGNKYIDMNAGIAVLGLGTAPDPVIKAVERQIRKFIHYSYTDFYYENIVTLAKELIKITPGSFEKKVYYGNSGAEAVEAAIKLVRYYTKRPRLLAFIGSFHGRTMGALSLTASKPAQVRGFSPLLPGVEHVPYPYCYRCPFKLTYPNCNLYCVDYIKENLFQKYVPPDEVAAAFIEPIQGEGGYVVPPDGYFKKFFNLMKENGIIVVDDEVQAGMGRTGKWFAIEHFGVEPDVILIAKALASGLPLSAVVSRAELMSWPPGSHASTFGGNPVATEAAIATINAIRKMKLLENAEKVGKYMLKRLDEIKEKHEIVGDVRGKGLMIGAEIVKNKETKEPNPDGAKKIIEYSWKHGVLLITAGISTLRFAPPLTITEDLVSEALDVVEKGIMEAEKE
jgi:4-aminobutyrate aminotransferase